MRRLRTGATLGLAVVLLGAVAGRAEPPFGDAGVRRALREATVSLETGCAGVLAESTQLVLTARHCVERAGQSMELRFSTGERRTGWIVATSRSSDQAVLFLEDPVPIEPLSVVRRPQIPGTVLYFAGNPKRPRFQSARLDRIGRCPSLPDLPNALFTSIKGTPGDSGAPLVDAAARVVGLVHGGPNCHIATPADSLIRLVDQVLDRDLVQLTDTGGRGRVTESVARATSVRGGGAAVYASASAPFGDGWQSSVRAAPKRRYDGGPSSPLNAAGLASSRPAPRASACASGTTR